QTQHSPLAGHGVLLCDPETIGEVPAACNCRHAACVLGPPRKCDANARVDDAAGPGEGTIELIADIQKHGDARDTWCNLLEQLQPYAMKIRIAKSRWRCRQAVRGSQRTRLRPGRAQ